MQKLNEYGSLAVAAIVVFFFSSVAFGQADPVSKLTCNPSSVTSGTATTCTVTVSAAAPAGGIEVLLSSNNTLLPVSTSVTVPAGTTSTTFTATAGAVTVNQNATLTATSLNSVMLNWTASTSQSLKNYNVYRSGTSGGPYNLLTSAGMATTYTDYNTQNGNTYYYVTTAVNTAGQESAYSNQAMAALPSGVSQTVTVSLVASATSVTLSSLTCSPTTLNSGTATTCTVRLSSAAPTGGTVVSLASNNTLLPVPAASVTVPAGAISTTFTATAGTVTSNQTGTLTATLSGVSQTASISLAESGAAPVTSICGETGQSSTDSQNADWPFASACVTGSDANGYTPASIQYWVGNPTSTSFDFGIYADSSGSPGSLLCHTGTQTLTPVAGWNNISLSGAGCATLSANTRYWLGYITGSNTIQQGIVTGNCPGTSLVSVYASSPVASALLPNPIGAKTATPSCYSMYLVLDNK
jgi:trimeric autotransporter adhesin